MRQYVRLITKKELLRQLFFVAPVGQSETFCGAKIEADSTCCSITGIVQTMRDCSFSASITKANCNSYFK